MNASLRTIHPSLALALTVATTVLNGCGWDGSRSLPPPTDGGVAIADMAGTCTRHDQCPAGQECRGNRCQAPEQDGGARCTKDSDCASGQACKTNTGVCEDKKDPCDGKCLVGQECNRTTGECILAKAFVTIEVSTPDPAEAHVYAANPNRLDQSLDHYGPTPHKVELSEDEACAFGVDIAIRDSTVPQMSWYSCESSKTLSLATVKINGTTTTGERIARIWACDGVKLAHLYFTPKQLGCP